MFQNIKGVSPETLACAWEIYGRIIGLRVVRSALERIRRENPSHLQYHVLQHTHEVIFFTILLSLVQGLSEKEIELLAIAAAYHDIGYVVRDANNEVIGALMARESMKRFGYHFDEARDVASWIMDTQLKLIGRQLQQSASTTFSSVLTDADIANFGLPNFFEKRNLIFKENGAKDWREFLIQTLNLLTNGHEWKTQASILLFQEQKEQNISQQIWEMRRLHLPVPWNRVFLST